MDDGYKTLLGRPQPAQDMDPGLNAGQRKPFGWEEADGAGPDRLFNRYRRLRLDAWTAAGTEPAPAGAHAVGAEPTVRCPATPSATRA